MNNFTYKDTDIIESQFDFSQLDGGPNFSGKVTLSATIAIPKDPQNNQTVVCTIDLSMGTESDEITLHVNARSFFEIEGTVIPETLQADAQAKCFPKAGEVLSDRIAELTRLHIGTPINIPIPQDF